MRLVVLVVGVVMVELRPKREGTPRVANEGTGGYALLPRGGVRGSRQGKSVLQTGTTRSREVSARIGVTNDEAENAPRLKVANGEDSKESEPPLKRRVRTHTASAQDSSTPVPWRWRSREARIRGLQRTRPFPRGYLDRGTPGSLLMAFPGTGNKGVTSTDASNRPRPSAWGRSRGTWSESSNGTSHVIAQGPWPDPKNGV